MPPKAPTPNKDPNAKVQQQPKRKPGKRKPRKPTSTVTTQKLLLKDAICKVLDYCETEKKRCQLTVPLTHPYSRVAAMFQLSLSSIERTRRKQRNGFQYVAPRKPSKKKLLQVVLKPDTVGSDANGTTGVPTNNVDHFALANSIYKNQFDFESTYNVDKGNEVPGVSGNKAVPVSKEVANKMLHPGQHSVPLPGPQPGPHTIPHPGIPHPGLHPSQAKMDYQQYQQRQDANIYHNMRVPDFIM